MDGANSAPAAMAPGAGDKLRAWKAERAVKRAGGVQLDLLGGPAVPEALTPAYEPASPNRPVDMTPTGRPNSDTRATPPARVSDRNRPVGPLRSGRQPTGTGAIPS